MIALGLGLLLQLKAKFQSSLLRNVARPWRALVDFEIAS
jgi:hypothetical protein